MRRFLIVICVLMTALVAGAQSRYVVYKCTEGVTVKKFRSDEWTSVQKYDEVSLVDVFSVKEDASLVILDNRNRSLYKFGSVTEKSLKFMIDDAVRNADDVTANLNKELMSKTDKSRQYTQIAAAYRGAEDSEGQLDSLSSFIVSSLSESKRVPVSLCYGLGGYEDRFTMDVIGSYDDGFHFAFSNNSPEDVFVNVVCVDADGRYSLCYDFGYSSAAGYIFIPAGNAAEMPQYEFVRSSQQEKYHLLVTPEPYDSHALQMLLSKLK